MKNPQIPDSSSLPHSNLQSAALWRYPLLALVVLAALMRLIDLGVKSVWFDETHSYADAFRDYVWYRRYHVLYYQMVKGSILAGGFSDFWLRLPSAMFGILSVYIMCIMTVEVFDDRRAGLMAGVFTCLSLTHLNYSQEARYYAVMFCLSALSLYLLARFYRRGSVSSLALLPIVCLLNYFTHPVTLVLSGLILMWCLLGLVATSRGRGFLRNAFDYVKGLINPPRNAESAKKKKKRSASQVPIRHRAWFRYGLLIAMAAGLIVAVPAVWFVAREVLRRLPGIQWFSAPAKGVELTWDFFFTSHFLPYGPGENEYLKHAPMLSKPLVILYWLIMIVGYGRALFKKWLFGSLAIVSIIATFVLLFSIGWSLQYYYKYVIYLFPLHIACLMYGLSGIGDWVGHLAARRQPAAKVWGVAAVLALFWLPNGLLWGGALVKYYTWERSGAKPALQDVLREFDPESDYIAAYGVTTYVLNYYAKQWDLPRDRIISVLHEKGDGAHTIARMTRAASQGGRVWFLHTWKWDMKERVFDWVQDKFDLVMTSPSLYGPDRDVTLWEWKYAGRVVSSQREVTIQPADKQSDGVDQGATGDGVFYTYMSMECQVEVPLSNLRSDETTSTLRLYFDQGGSLAFDLGGAPDSQNYSQPIWLPAGENRVVAEWGDGSDEALHGIFPAVSIRTAESGRIEYQAVAFDSINPLTDYMAQKDEQGDVLELPYNNIVGYEFDVKAGGDYLVGLSATHDAPGPVLFQCSLNGQPVGLLGFQRADQSIGDLRFPVTLQAGTNEFQFAFLSDRFTGGELPDDQDTDAILHQVFIERAAPDVDRRDDRIWLPDNQVVDIGRYIAWPPDSSANGAGSWQISGFIEPRIEAVDSNGVSHRAFSGMLAYEQKGAQAVSPPFPVAPGQFVYFSTKVRSSGLQNHVANVLVAFVAANGQTIEQRWVNGQGVYEDTNEVEVIAFLPVPNGATRAVIGLATYSRGRKDYSSHGQVWYYDFQPGLDLISAMRLTQISNE